MLGTPDDMLGTPDALLPGYTHFEVYPQPGALAWASLSLPTVRGTIELRFNQTTNAFDASLTIPTGSTARVCLPPLAAASAAAGKQPLHDEAGRQASDTLTVDGSVVDGVVEGRMLCAPTPLTAGAHTIVR